MGYNEQLDYCRLHSRSDGFIYCDDCVMHCKISDFGCSLRPDSGTLEYCEFFICDGSIHIENSSHFAE